MAEVEPESLFAFLDAYLEVEGFPDYPPAHNGVQVELPGPVRRIAAAVDASEETIGATIRTGADLLLVHHGLFWGGGVPVRGRSYRRLAPLLREGVGVYAAHLPLDAHPEVGNCAELARALGFSPADRFGSFEGREIGFAVDADETVEALADRAASVLGGPVRTLAGGPERVRRLGTVTGGGGSFLRAAAASGIDTLLTGEASHHAYVDAHELGINVLLGGHYRTETWGVRALAARIEEELGIPWTFLDFPSGL